MNNHILIHWLRALFRGFVLLLMIPLLLIALLLLTPMGLKISLTVLTHLVPGELHYQQADGALMGPFTIKQLSYRYQDREISASHLTVQWHPSVLLVGKILIDTIRVDDLKINTPQAPAPKPPASLAEVKQNLTTFHPLLTSLSLPFKLQINHAQINRLTWQRHPGEPTLVLSPIKTNRIKIEPRLLKADVQVQLTKPFPTQAQLILDGTPQQYHFELILSNPITQAVINGDVNPEQITFDSQKAMFFGGELTAHGVWKWQKPMSWRLALTGRRIDMSRLYPNWPSPLDINLNTTGQLGAERPQFSWDLWLKTPQTQITTQGHRDQQWDIQWNIQIHQLAELFPFSSGTVNTTGELHGSLDKPQTKGTLQASLLRWKDYRIDKMNTAWNVDATQTRDSFVQAGAEQLFIHAVEIQSIQLSAKGKWDQHQLNARVNAYNTDLSLQLAGGMTDKQWQGALQKLTVSQPDVGDWTLTQPTALFISPQKAEVSALCLQSTTHSQLCGRGLWNGADKSWNIAATGRLNFQQLAAWAPPQLSINFPLDIHLNAEGVGKAVKRAQLTGNMPSGDIRISNHETTTIPIKSTQLTAHLDKNGASMDVKMELTENNFLSASLSLPRLTSTHLFAKDQSLQGKITVELNNLAPIQAFIPQIVTPHGKFQAHLMVSGTVGEPLVSGQAHIEGGEIKIPGLNIQLNEINLALNTRGRAINYTLTATSANRPLQLVGETHLQAGLPTEFTLTGDTVLLIDTPRYTLYVSPNVHLRLNGRNVDITGSVEIPKGVLHELTFQYETTLPENEVVFIGEHPVSKATPWKTTIDLTIHLGQDVTVDSPGLKGKLTGSVTVLSQPGQVMLGVGQIDIVNGTYEVFGRQLTIMPGSGIIYRRNSLDNPILNIQASTRVVVTDIFSRQQLGANELTVGMNIGGTSSSPQVTLFSSAGNLSQADILSYLLLGTSSSGISPTNMNLLLQALNNLPLTKTGAGNVKGLTDQIKQSLGLEFGVESAATLSPTGEVIPTTTAPTSYFVVGKRLTSRIYLRYKYDPFNSVNLFQLNYLLSQNWSIQLETDGSTQSGADILYTIQTGVPKSADKSTTTTSSK